MSDVQQWRRMIQPVRVRTPAAIDIEETDNFNSALPTTPKISLKPKFSSYFVSHGNSAVTTAKVELPTPPFDETSSPRLPTWANDEVFPTPSAEGMIDSIMCRLMSDPYTALEPRFNGMLLHIFEAFRNINVEKIDLQAQVHQEVTRFRALFKRFHEAQKEWADEREDFKTEVKRLEVLLSKGKRGVAEVTLARQDSRLRQKEADRRSRADEHGLEVIFDMLEKNKRWSSQRATFKVRQPSPSAKMRRLSKQLHSKKMDASQGLDLPVGTLPDVARKTLADVSTLEVDFASEGNRMVVPRKSISEPKTSMSDDTASTFSCMGDPLPDEMPERLVRAVSIPNRTNNALPTPKSVQKQPSLISKASGFFQKLRPQINFDTAGDAPEKIAPKEAQIAKFTTRRFSFEVGDDAGEPSPSLDIASIAPERILRSSVSMSALPEVGTHSNPMRQSLSPLAQSPPASASPLEYRRVSRIPTPVYHVGSLARPRREREDSASSLLTIIRHAEGVTRCASQSSSILSTPSDNRSEFIQRHAVAAGRLAKWKRGGIGNGLLEHTNALRGNTVVAAALHNGIPASAGSDG